MPDGTLNFSWSDKVREWMAKKERSSTARKKKSGETAGEKMVAGASVRTKGSPRKAILKVTVISSKLSYEGPLFRVYTDEIIENGREMTRDVVRHNGSIVILAVDDTKSKRDPMIVMERQYRHAAKEYLLEVPAGKMEEGEDALVGAKRELLEETGFKAAHWRKMVRYYASPGFLGEFMQVFIAEGLTAGEAQPEFDEQLEIEMLPLSALLKMIDRGEVQDGKTLISVMLYERLRKSEKKKNRK
jgi:ADP-ribose pyrophosphatase